jgi:opacity protein-like surface antigen
MKKFVLINFLLLLVLIPAFGTAKDLSSVQMIGIRMGFWNAPKTHDIQTTPGQEITTKVTAPYAELFISPGLKKGFALEFSFGSCYRGETRYHDPYGYYWKKVTVYPVSGGVKFYPLSSVKNYRWQPYTYIGFAFITGVEEIRLGEYFGSSVLVQEGTNTYTTLGWQAGLGMDVVLSRFWVIGADFKYRGVKFKDEVGGLKNFNGPQVTLGVSYIVKGI